MKFSCCSVLAILLIVVIGIQIWTINLIRRPTPSATPIPTSTPTLSTATPTPAPTSTTDAKLLYSVNNPAACSQTDTARFELTEDHEITKLQTWYNWGSNEITLDYVVKHNGEEVYKGVLLRKDCDPYQKQWCQAVDESVDRQFIKGEYQLVADAAHICQNTQSANQGFIFVYGR